MRGRGKHKKVRQRNSKGAALPLIAPNDILLIVGPPGSGKGTQTPVLEDLGWSVVSTGALLRKEIASQTKLGQMADALLREGQLFPDDLTLKMLEAHLPDTNCVLDGYPRTARQCADLDQLLASQGRKVGRVLYLSVPDVIVVNRVLNRRTCEDCSLPASPEYGGEQCLKCGSKLVKRVDDNERTMEKRLKVYHQQTSGVLLHYKDRVAEFNGIQNPTQIGNEIRTNLTEQTE